MQVIIAILTAVLVVLAYLTWRVYKGLRWWRGSTPIPCMPLRPMIGFRGPEKNNIGRGYGG